MGAKTWAPGLQAIKFTYDFAVNGGAVGTIALGNLPDSFVVVDSSVHVETALVGGGTFVVGEDGGGAASGYWTDLDAATVGTALKGTGSLVSSQNHIVAAAKDGVQVTIATTAYTAGKLNFHFIGYQA